MSTSNQSCWLARLPAFSSSSPSYLLLIPAEAQQAHPSAAFQEMVNIVHQQLTPNVYHFIFDASNVEDNDQNQAPNAEQKVRRAKKEGKQIGLLVKAIEEWEFNLIKLTRSCKSCIFGYGVKAVMLPTLSLHMLCTCCALHMLCTCTCYALHMLCTCYANT